MGCREIASGLWVKKTRYEGRKYKSRERRSEGSKAKRQIDGEEMRSAQQAHPEASGVSAAFVVDTSISEEREDRTNEG